MTDYINDIPKYRKKSTASPPAKSKHKHVYEPCLLEFPWRWWKKPHEKDYDTPKLEFRSYCPVCGKVGDVDLDRWRTTVKKYHENSGSYIEVANTEEAERELNPATRTLPVFKVEDPFAKFVEIGE